jgi:uncharacterized protein YjbJ (UPF0337 family)
MADPARHGATGAWEGVKGWVKKAAGRLSGQRDLEREGLAQEDRAAAERDAARREAEAGRARVEAEMHEAEQRRAQRDQ